MRWSSVAAVLAVVVVSGCSASPPPAPVPPPASSSPADSEAYHWVGEFCSGPSAALLSLKNTGYGAIPYDAMADATVAERQKAQQDAELNLALLDDVVKSNAAHVAGASPSPARDRLTAVYTQLKADLTRIEHHVTGLVPTAAATFGPQLAADAGQVHTSFEAARHVFAAEPATARFMRDFRVCS
ncbi:hypothetical protein [Amycolatopsis sp. DSM 110486]|uniref:hypothetical protein n=1 Tax=Amycolatopsis sp. DSM 110486 TaxID=2865832 RepID=UPI001C6A1B2F|nr:hypothetical protein [Amycolatopsis sp. DSM 110486]QYN24941.1 hypothetical protein K1T34_22410 [Amycolatopsis sp. DSM 110486]